MFQVPLQYIDFNGSTNYVTHYGEIYPGRILHCPNYDDGVFIIADHNIKVLNGLSEEEKTPAMYRELGWEIRNFNVIAELVSDLFPHKQQQLNPQTIHIPPNKFKRMFVFGAAASKYCLYELKLQKELENQRFCPPLGAEMFDSKFDELCKKYPGVLQTLNEWDITGKDIEALLEEQWGSIQYNFDKIIHARHLNIQFFLQELFIWISEQVNNYYFRSNLFDLLVEKIRRKNLEENGNTAYVSFNYDTILDNYISNIHGVDFKNMSDYINPENQFILLKPHGSANWGFKYFNSAMPPEQRKNVSDWLFKTKSPLSMVYYHLLGGYADSVHNQEYGFEYSIKVGSKKSKYTINKNKIEIIPVKDWKDNYFPALLMPYRDKDEFVMPYNHQLALRLLCQQAEELYLIGWKGSEDLFNKQFSTQNKLKKIIIINPNLEMVKENIGKYINLSNIEIIHIPDFKTFVLNQLDNYLNGLF